MDAQSRKPYPRDLNDAEWAILDPMWPPPLTVGAPRRTNVRAVINAIF